MRSSPRASSGLEHVAGVHRTLGAAGTDHRVHLVDEEDDLALGVLDLLSTALRRSSNSPRYLAPATIAARSSERLLVLEAFGHVALDDALGEALDDRGLADPGLADEDRVVLGAATQHSDDAADLLVAADDRIELRPLAPAR